MLGPLQKAVFIPAGISTWYSGEVLRMVMGASGNWLSPPALSANTITRSPTLYSGSADGDENDAAAIKAAAPIARAGFPLWMDLVMNALLVNCHRRRSSPREAAPPM